MKIVWFPCLFSLYKEKSGFSTFFSKKRLASDEFNIMSDEVGSLEAAALKRKERLAALRAAKQSKTDDQGSKDKPLPA